MPNMSYKRFIYDHELMLYPYAPLGILHNQGNWPTPKYNLGIIANASIKDLNIVEWLTYHQALGIDHIYLYCTDSDPTDLYRQLIPFTLGEKPFITFHHYRFSQSKTQIYFHFIRNYLHETTWHIHLEMVDYLYVNENQSLSDFINNFTDIKAVYFNMVLYNNKEPNASANIKTLFEKNSPINYPYIYTKLMVKSQTCPYQYIFRNLNEPTDHHINDNQLILSSCNVLQQDMREYYKNFPQNALKFMHQTKQENIIKTAYIAHFCNTDDEQKNINDLSSLYIQNSTQSIMIEQYSSNKYWGKNIQPLMIQQYSPNKYWIKNKKNIWRNSLFPAPSPSLSVLSNKKPCQQSSALLKKTTTENLAYILTNGQLKGVAQSITQKENDPWWEIDLQNNYIIKNIYLFNGIDPNISNMIHFIIESSEDKEIWIKRHEKTTANLFGGVDGSYYKWLHPLGMKARWIRITIRGENQIFSLDQIRILGIEC